MESDPHIRSLKQQVLDEPNKSEWRLQLAAALADRNRLKEALAEVQIARQDSDRRDEAMELQQRILKLLE